MPRVTVHADSRGEPDYALRYARRYLDVVGRRGSDQGRRHALTCRRRGKAAATLTCVRNRLPLRSKVQKVGTFPANLMKTLMILAIALMLAACGPHPLVRTDFDPSADFSRYGSYAWRQEPPVSNPLMRQRLIEAIDARLAERGWAKVTEDRADIALVANVATHEEQSLETFYGGPDWGSWEWRHAGGMDDRYRTERIYSYTVGTLVLDMFDTRTRRAVWRASAEGAVPATPEKTREAIRRAVDEMFAAFPPGR